MLLVVLVLILAAFGLLLAALVSSTMLWAWFSVGASVLGALLLVFDWSRRRRRAAMANAAMADWATGDDGAVDAPAETNETDDRGESGNEADSHPALTADSSSTPADYGTSSPAGYGSASRRGSPPPDADPDLDLTAEPAEEASDVADVLAVSESTAEVVVVDERPRYHLPTCAWLAARETIPIPVGEARDLGFTPCAICHPDHTLAATTRAARSSG